MAKAEKAAPAQGGMKNLLLLGVVALIAGGAGFALPQFFSSGAPAKDANKGQDAAKHTAESKPAFVPFGDVIVNLSDGRLTRYLRIKLILVVDHLQEKPFTEMLLKNKAILKNWLLSYLSDQSMEGVSGAAGINRLRREIQDQFNILLFPDGSEKIRDILFEEFVVQ